MLKYSIIHGSVQPGKVLKVVELIPSDMESMDMTLYTVLKLHCMAWIP
jgi:hypothetical protein